nr:thioredoxin domain-containing protein [Acidobacteriota bacterium]
VLFRLALLFGEDRYAEAATKTLAAIAPLAERYPSGFGLLLGAAEWRAGQPKEIVITGEIDDATFRQLRKTVGEEFLPHRVLVAGSGSADLPLMRNRPAERAMAYICEAHMCAEPTTDAERLRTLLTIVSR